MMSTEPYVPELGIEYPSNPDGRMVEVKVIRDVQIDENYQFMDKSLKFRFMRALTYLGIFTIVFFMSPARFGLRVEGRGVLRKHRKLLKDGAMTISNHMHRWDFLFVLQALRHRMMYFPVKNEHLSGPDGSRIRFAGGIPVPSEISVIRHFYKAFDEIRAKKKWIHAFPESTRFDYFQPIRPFKKGVFTMVQRYDVPVLPMAFSYGRPPLTPANLLRSLSGKQKLPAITLRIGEPILLDKSLPRKEAVQKLRKDCHEAVVRLAGIRDNPYPAEGD